MKDKDMFRVITVRQAAIWMGCSPAMLLDLKRRGWLHSIEKLQRKANVLRKDETYWLWQLHVLTWDIAYGLSFWDIAAILASTRSPVEVALKSGIPIRVVQLVRDAEVFEGIRELLLRHAPKRSAKNIDGADVYLPEGEDWFKLTELLADLSARNPARLSRDASSPARILPGLVSSPLARVGTDDEPDIVRWLTRKGRRKPLRVIERWKWNQGALDSMTCIDLTNRKYRAGPTE